MKPPNPRGARRTGKIARLPESVRLQVNSMLNDGLPYAQIRKNLAEHGAGLNPNNLSRWRHGGFQDWLNQQLWLDEIRLKLGFCSELIQQKDGNHLNEGSLRLAVAQIASLLLALDSSALKDKSLAELNSYSRLLSTLCKLTDGSLKYERHRDQKTR
jgi:hypothetical protein